MNELKFIQNQLEEALKLFDDKKIDRNLMYDYIFEAKNTVDNLIMPENIKPIKDGNKLDLFFKYERWLNVNRYESDKEIHERILKFLKTN